MRLSRRAFIRDSTLIGSGLTIFGNGLFSRPLPGELNTGSLKGFIVSDAHFGWLGKDQPSNEEIHEAVNRILKRFPDLDLFIDTGDAHHNYAREKSKGDWLENIANHCGMLPFFYVAGNHENWTSRTTPAPWVTYDSELECAKLGSMPLELYYSFDYKGIHFISLPQLMNQAYISDAEIDWLELDLEIAKDRSTIILSHNSIQDTTEYFSDIGYRQTANSQRLLKLFSEHPNIISWMHGHNHTYEVIYKYNMVFVSNGRIGGFNPQFPGSYGKDNLGGIYFEVSEKNFVVRGYSATRECFIDELPDHDHVQHKESRETSFDKNSGFAFNIGAGKQAAGTARKINHHFAGGNRRLLARRAASQVINENPDLSVYTQRKNKNWRTKHLAGYSFMPLEENEVKEDPNWEWTEDGVIIFKRDPSAGPKTIFTPEIDISSRSYYKCVPGKKYRIRIEVDSPSAKAGLSFIFLVHDRNYSKIWESRSRSVQLKRGMNRYTHVFEVPLFQFPETLYHSMQSENTFHFAAGAEFSNLDGDILLKSVAITCEESRIDKISDGIDFRLNNRQIHLQNREDSEQICHGILPSNPDYFENIRTGENTGITSWILRHEAPAWQVRNATVHEREGTLHVGPLRNRFSGKDEIVIVPTSPCLHPFVHKSRGINDLKIKPLGGLNTEKLVIEVGEVTLNGFSELEILGELRPLNVLNAVNWSYDTGRLVIKANQNSSIEIIYNI